MSEEAPLAPVSVASHLNSLELPQVDFLPLRLDRAEVFCAAEALRVVVGERAERDEVGVLRVLRNEQEELKRLRRGSDADLVLHGEVPVK